MPTYIITTANGKEYEVETEGPTSNKAVPSARAQMTADQRQGSSAAGYRGQGPGAPMGAGIFTSGGQQVMRGAQRFLEGVEAGGPPAQNFQEFVTRVPRQDFDKMIGGTSDMFRGAGQMAAPVAGPVALFTAPAATVGGVALGAAGSALGGSVARNYGLSPGAVQVAEDAGGIIGGTVGSKLGGMLRGGLQSFANSRMRSALSPTKGNAPEPADIRRVAQTALEQNIPLNEQGISRVEGLKREVWNNLTNLVSQKANQGARIRPEDIANQAQVVRDRFAKDFASKDDLRAIDSVVDEFLTKQGARPAQASPIVTPQGQKVMTPARPANPMNPVDVLEAKSVSSQNLGGKAWGELKGAEVEARKALIRGAKVELEKLSPEIQAYNQKYGNLADLEPVLKDAVRRDYTRHTGLNDTATVGVGGALAGPQGVATGLGIRTLAKPSVQAKMAHVIYKGSKLTGQPLNWKQALARAASITSALNQQENEQ